MAKLLGTEKVMRNLNREIAKIKGRTTAGLIEASIVIRRDMDARPPLIPVDFGNLRASWFTTTGKVNPEVGGNFKGEDSGKLTSDHNKVLTNAAGKAKVIPHPILIMGFSAAYSGVVHESLKTSVLPGKDKAKKRRPGSGPKFFESAIKRNHKTVLNIIAKNVKF